MQRKGSFVRYTADELSKLESETDWAKVDATTKDEVERQAEVDDGLLPQRWEDTVLPGVPRPKRGVYLRLDPDVLEWFKAHGRGYQTRINAALRAVCSSSEGGGTLGAETEMTAPENDPDNSSRFT